MVLPPRVERLWLSIEIRKGRIVMAGSGDVLGQMIDAVVRGGALKGGSGAGGSAGGLGDILGGLLGGAGGGQGSPGGGNLGDILGSVLGGGQDGGGRAAGGPAAPGGLGDILGSILGGGAAGSAAGGGSQGGVGGSLGDVLGGMLGGGVPAGGSGGGGTGGGVAPANAPQGGGMGNLAKYGGIAVISMLALQALKKWQAQKAGASTGSSAVPSPSGFDLNRTPGGPDALSDLLVKAMIAATQADGVVDEDEQRRIVGRLDQLGIGAGARGAIADQMRRRVDPNELVNAAQTPEMALQVYAASALAISIDTPPERAYLDKLAAALGIDAGLKSQIENTLGRA
jgi:uncharacterized membrane protein YebE (DUF533 family)